MTKPSRPAILHPDGKARCPWPGTDPFYIAYHDEDWGVPEFDDRALFEKLVLDGFQAGLSWITILRKRENFRSAFDGFHAATIAEYRSEKIEALLLDPGIIRSRLKIEAAVRSAQVYLDIHARQGFAHYLWDFVDGRPLQHHYRTMEEVPASTPLSEKIAKDLKKRGFKFCGPTIVYAFMQAVGMANDHLTGCFRHAECAALGEKR